MLKIGVIGVYGRAYHAERAHRPEQGVRIVAGADVKQEYLDAFQKKFPGISTFLDWRELLKSDIDAVFIMAPDYLHEEMAVAALKAGKAVYLEKPMAITVEGADRILAAAAETGTKLFVGHNMRYRPMIVKMKEIIDSGVIGEIQTGWCRHFVGYGGDAYFCDWHAARKYSNGLLLQKGCHDIDVMHWLMGGVTRSVVGMGMLSVYSRCGRRAEPGRARPWSNQNWPPLALNDYAAEMDVEDLNMVMMQLDNGTQAAYLQCHYTPESERNFTFIGTRGRIENIGYGDGEIHVWTRRGPRSTPDIIYRISTPPEGHGGADQPIMDAFLDYVLHDKFPNPSPLAARDAVAAGALGHDSMRNGNNRRDVPPLDPAVWKYFKSLENPQNGRR